MYAYVLHTCYIMSAVTRIQNKAYTYVCMYHTHLALCVVVDVYVRIYCILLLGDKYMYICASYMYTYVCMCMYILVCTQAAVDTSLSVEEQHEFCRILKRVKTHHAGSDGIISVKAANNADVHLAQLPNPRIGSADCSSRTRRPRAQLLEHIHTHVSSPTDARTNTQHEIAQHTLHIIRNKEQFEASARAAGIVIQHKFSVQDMLEFEKLTAIPYNLLRSIRSFFNSKQLSVFQSERQIRKAKSKLLYDCEAGTVTVHGKEVAWCRVVNVGAVAESIVRSLHAHNELVCYANMSGCELWICIQCDQGGPGTKLGLQVLNRSDIHSVKNFITLGYYEGYNEDYDAVSAIFAPLFEQIGEWQRTFHLSLHPASQSSPACSLPPPSAHVDYNTQADNSNSNTYVSGSCKKCKRSHKPPSVPYTPVCDQHTYTSVRVFTSGDIKMLRLMIGMFICVYNIYALSV